jgi:DNA-binding MltR family transcriptional regulator
MSDLDFTGTIELLAKQTHAGKALIYAGVIDEWLQKLLLHHMRPLSGKQLERLFNAYGPVSSFSGRMDIAFAFKLISDDVYENLRIIKDIRNKFAHTVTPLNFTSSEIAEQCRRFKAWKQGVNNEALYYERVAFCAVEMEKKIESSLIVEALAGQPSSA